MRCYCIRFVSQFIVYHSGDPRCIDADTAEPKHPVFMNPFAAFVHGVSAQYDNDLVAMATAWHQMPEPEKHVFRQKYDAAKGASVPTKRSWQEWAYY